MFLLAFSFNTQGKDSISWAVGHLPPKLILEEPDKLGGQGGIQLQLLQDKLKDEYQHRNVDMNWLRFENEQKSQNKVCSSFMVKNAERLKYSVFSLPWGIELSLKIIMRSNTFDAMGRPALVSMSELLQNDSLAGVLVEGRTYYSLEEIISAHTKTNITRLPTNANKLLAMLNAGRFDYFVEYPHVAMYMQEQSGDEVSAIAPVTIKEGFEYIFSRIACPNNQWGKQVIERVNEIIRQERAKPNFLALLQMIHPRDEERQKVAEIYHRDFMTAEQ